MTTSTQELARSCATLPQDTGVIGRKRRRGRAPEERGSLSVEIVILGAVIVVTLCLGVGAGTLVLADGRVSAAAASAARAASLESSPQAATNAARSAAARTISDAGTTCTPDVDVDTSQFRAGGRVQVQVHCRINLSLVAIAGFGAHRELTATAAAPLEQHRSFQERP